MLENQAPPSIRTTTLICLAGPTASGKSTAALALARRWPIEIICMDSATVYRGMDIGTAKPDLAERRQVAHHLLDVRDPANAYSAAEFATDAAALAQAIHARGHVPLLCGGTMLYYKALRDGLHALPPANPAVRAQLDAEAQQRGWPALHDALAAVDPASARRIAPNDQQRLQRALEIWRTSKRTMSDWLAQPAQTALPGWRHATISLEPDDRDQHRAHIAQRFRAMMDDGLLAEVRGLHRRPELHPGLPSIRCVGYRQLWRHLDGQATLDEAIEQAIAATRQLAKRQLTWLRALPERVVIDGQAADAGDQVTRAVERLLGRRDRPL